MQPGTHFGHYEIVSWRATDTRLDRAVATKGLPEHLAADPKRRYSFERGAKAVNRLNHWHTRQYQRTRWDLIWRGI